MYIYIYIYIYISTHVGGGEAHGPGGVGEDEPLVAGVEHPPEVGVPLVRQRHLRAAARDRGP